MPGVTDKDVKIDELLEQAKRAESELNQLQNNFLSMAGHEFRTPLTVIDSVAHRLGRKAGTYDQDDIREKVATIRTTVTKLVSLVDRTFEIARLTMNGFVLQPSACSFSRLVQNACAGQRIVTPNVEITLDLGDSPDVVVGDGRFIDAVIEKLLFATATTIKRNGRLDVSSWVEDEDVFLSIKCHCEVFSSRALNDLRAQLDDSLKAQRLMDRGMEFKLAKFLIEMHQGEIDFVSDHDQCFEIEVRLPIQLNLENVPVETVEKKMA